MRRVEVDLAKRVVPAAVLEGLAAVVADGTAELERIRKAIEDIFELLAEGGALDVPERPVARLVEVEGGETGGEETAEVVESGAGVEVGAEETLGVGRAVVGVEAVDVVTSTTGCERR